LGGIIGGIEDGALNVQVNRSRGERPLLGFFNQCLGDLRGAATLGVGASLGAATWQCQNKFEVIVGPLRITDFLNFLPGSDALEQLRDMVRLYTNDEWSCQIRLLLRVKDVPRAKLDGKSQLGWTAWLGGRQVTASDVVLRGNRVALDKIN